MAVVEPGQHDMSSESAPAPTGMPDMRSSLEGAAEHGHSTAATQRKMATVAYFVVAFGHGAAVVEMMRTSTSEGLFAASIIAVQFSLALESLVSAAGGFPWLLKGRSKVWACGLEVLERLARVRFFATALTWPWLVPWAAELACSCSAAPEWGPHFRDHGRMIAMLIGGVLIAREVTFQVRGEPPSVNDASQSPQFGDCLPRNALFGGLFRLDKAELEATGRAVFVPARPREGLYIGSGLALLSHLVGGLAMLRSGGNVMWIGGALIAFAGRRIGSRRPQENLKWRDAGPVVCRLAELLWMWCCIRQLQFCEAAPFWKPCEHSVTA